MLIKQTTSTIYFCAPSEYNHEKDKLIIQGWRELEEHFSFSPNGIYATFIKYNK